MRHTSRVIALVAMVLAGCGPVNGEEQSPASPSVAPTTKGNVLSLGVARSGIVRAILVRDGARVEAGQLLLQLDCRPLEKEIDFRAASLAAEEAALTRVRNGSRPEEIAIGEAAVGVATARVEEAREALDRANALQVGVSITRADLFLAQRDYRIAAAELVDAEKRLALLKAGTRAEDIAEAQAKRDAGAAFLEEGKAELDQCAVRAPVAGTVQIAATVGQFVSVLTQAPLVQLTTDPAAE
jgi:HlyD family secretion protein